MTPRATIQKKAASNFDYQVFLLALHPNNARRSLEPVTHRRPSYTKCMRLSPGGAAVVDGERANMSPYIIHFSSIYDVGGDRGNVAAAFV
jgi:hypothetical protein